MAVVHVHKRLKRLAERTDQPELPAAVVVGHRVPEERPPSAAVAAVQHKHPEPSAAVAVGVASPSTAVAVLAAHKFRLGPADHCKVREPTPFVVVAVASPLTVVDKLR